jgi:hypothetical protein
MVWRAVPDFQVRPREDIRECRWFRPLTVQLVGEPPPGDLLLERFVGELLAGFGRQGHSVLASSRGDVDLLLACEQVPDGPQPLRDRVRERPVPLAFALMREFRLRRRPEHLVALVSVPERLGELPHTEVVEAARCVMARIGTPKVVFVTGSRAGGIVEEATYCTLEGGHPTDRQSVADRVRDRLVSAACAREVGGAYDFVEGGLTAREWERTRTPDALVAAGRRMGGLGLLPGPRRVSDYVSAQVATFYQRFLGVKGFSEGMLFAFDPELRVLMVTASGSWEVDKRALDRDEVVAIGGIRDGRLQVLVPEGVRPKGPSVEGWEIYQLLTAVRRARVSRLPSGRWVPDARGAAEVPLIRGGFHAHVGVTAADPAVIESMAANRSILPYGFGCGTDLMREVGLDVAARSQALTGTGDERFFVRWPMLYHGETAVELWKPGVHAQPLTGLLDAYDPHRHAAVKWSADHVDQPE